MNAGLTGALVCGLGVGLGAFGAHGLKERVGAEQLAWFDTAVRYQMIHGLALLAMGALQRTGLSVGRAPLALLVGVIVFSGSLYAMVAGAPRWFGAITPLGGLAFLVGWTLLALSLRNA